MSDYNKLLFCLILVIVIFCFLCFLMFQMISKDDTKFSIKTTLLITPIIFMIVFFASKTQLEFYKIKEMPITEIQNYDSNKLEKYREYLIEDKNYKAKEKYIIKQKIDKYIKDNNLQINETIYREALDSNSLILENKVINFKATVKEVLLTPIEEIK